MTEEEYRAHPGVNQSTLKLMLKSPKHYKHGLEQAKKTTTAMLKGSAIHTMVFEPDLFRERFVVFPGSRRGKEWTAFKTANSGREILNEKEWEQVQGCASAVMTDPVACQYISAGRIEEPIIWTDSVTGIECKGRPDVSGDRLVELKTTAQIDPRLFSSLAYRLGYHVQTAYYLDGLTATIGTDCQDPIMIVVESVPPFDCIVYHVPEHVIEVGRETYRKLLWRVVECRDRGDWPGWGNGNWMPFELPEFAYAGSDDLQLTSGGETMRF